MCLNSYFNFTQCSELQLRCTCGFFALLLSWSCLVPLVWVGALISFCCFNNKPQETRLSIFQLSSDHGVSVLDLSCKKLQDLGGIYCNLKTEFSLFNP